MEIVAQQEVIEGKIYMIRGHKVMLSIALQASIVLNRAFWFRLLKGILKDSRLTLCFN